MSNAFRGLQAAIDPRNANLNKAYEPPWEAPDGAPMASVPQGNTQFDPLLGTGWGEALDAMGASDPGGAHLQIMKGLQGAFPQSPVPAGQQPFDHQPIGNRANSVAPNPWSR